MINWVEMSNLRFIAEFWRNPCQLLGEPRVSVEPRLKYTAINHLNEMLIIRCRPLPSAKYKTSINLLTGQIATHVYLVIGLYFCTRRRKNNQSTLMTISGNYSGRRNFLHDLGIRKQTKKHMDGLLRPFFTFGAICTGKNRQKNQHCNGFWFRTAYSGDMTLQWHSHFWKLYAILTHLQATLKDLRWLTNN